MRKWAWRQTTRYATSAACHIVRHEGTVPPRMASSAAALRDAARQLLGSITLHEYLASRPPSHVVTIQESRNVGDALILLNRHRLLSAPVISDSTGDVLGFFHVSNALSAFLEGVSPSLVRDGSQSTESKADELCSAGQEFCNIPLRSLKYGHDGVLAYVSRCSTSLLDLVDTFMQQGNKHRLAVWDLLGEDASGDAAMRVSSIVSQSDIIRYLAKHGQLLGADKLTIRDIQGWCTAGGLVTTTGTTPALSAFATMAKEKCSAIGITSHEGRLCGNLSQSDLRGLTPDTWGRLALPCAQFLVEQHGVELPSGLALQPDMSDPSRPCVYCGVVRQGEQPGDVTSQYVVIVTVKTSSSLSAVLEAMALHAVHHVWVVDESMMPVNVLTPSDVLHLVAGGVGRLRAEK